MFISESANTLVQQAAYRLKVSLRYVPQVLQKKTQNVCDDGVALAPYELAIFSSGCIKYTEEEVDCYCKERLHVAKLLENLNFPIVFSDVYTTKDS